MSNQPLGQMIIELGLDSSNFTRGMKGANQQIKTSMSEMKAHLAVLGQSGSALDKLKAKQSGLTSVVEAQNKKVDLARGKYEACKAAVEGNSDATQKQKDALIKAQNEYVKAIGELGSYENQLNEVNIRLTAMESGMYKTGDAMITFGDNMARVGDKVAAVGQSLVIGITTPIIALGTYAIKTAAEFDTSMSQVSAVSGAVGEDFNKLRDKAREMGEKTKFSAKEAADAMNYMAMAGWKTNDMLDGIEGIMSLAAASGEDLATTSDIVTDALTGFGKSAADSGKLADIMAAASSNANTNVGLMGETFKYCTPIAGALGFSMEDTAEAIGLMANSGIKGSMAGTAMRSMMNNLASDVTFTGKKFGDMTIKTQNQDGSMRDLNDILKDCRGAFSQMTDAEKVANAEALVGKNAMSGFLAVMNAAPGDVEKLNTAIANCDGTAEAMAATMQDNLEGQLTILKSQTDELAISFGDILMPKIRGIVSGIQGAVDAFNKMDDGTKNTIVNVALFAAVVGPVVLVVGKLTSGIGNLVSGIGKGLQSFALWAAKITSTTAATTTQTAAQIANTAATETGTAANAKVTASLLAKTAKTIADTVASKAHAAAEKVKNLAIAAGNGSLTAQVAAMNASIIAKAKDTAASIAHTAAEKARGLTLGITTGGVSLQTIATTAQTFATNACALATGLLSAAFKLLTGPIGWVIAGVTALVAGVVGLVKWFNKETEEAKRLKAETEELSEANDALTDSLETSRGAYEDNVKSIEAEAGAAKALADKVAELSKVENKTASQKKELSAYVGMLNDSMEGLNLQYDEQADALSMTTDEIYTQISALEEQAKAQAAQERMVEILKEQIVTGEQLTQVQDKIAETTENTSLKEKERKKILAELEEQEITLQGEMDSLGESYLYVTDIIVASTETEEEAVTGSTETIIESYGTLANAYEELGERQQEALDGILGAYETMTDSLGNLTNKIKLDSKTTWQKIQENQADTIEKTKRFSDLYAELITAGVSESYLNAIGATGPESIPLLEDMLAQGTDTVLASQAEWHDAYGVIGDTLTDSLELDDSVKGSIKEYIIGETGVLGTFKDTIEGAELNMLGQSITDGISAGIIESTEDATGAATDMADATTDAAKEAWDINSPSKVFAELGKYLVEGLAQGIAGDAGLLGNAFDSVVPGAMMGLEKSMAAAMPVIQKTLGTGFEKAVAEVKRHLDRLLVDVSDVITKADTAIKTGIDKIHQNMTVGMDIMKVAIASGLGAIVTLISRESGNIVAAINISSKMRDAGVNAMDGFRLGLDQAAPAVYQKAKSIADKVTKTISTALDIHSPSRVMMKLGQFTMQGFGSGMESMQGYIEGIVNNTSGSITSNLNGVLNGVDMGDLSINTALNDRMQAIEAINQTNMALTVDEAGGSDRDKTYDLLEQLLNSNGTMIKLLQAIAAKDLVINKRSLTNGLDTELGVRQALKERYV